VREHAARPLSQRVEALERDLARGVPLKDALAARKLPEFYVRMIQLGAQSNDLPGLLILVADYYQRAHLGWDATERIDGLPVDRAGGVARDWRRSLP